MHLWVEIIVEHCDEPRNRTGNAFVEEKGAGTELISPSETNGLGKEPGSVFSNGATDSRTSGRFLRRTLAVFAGLLPGFPSGKAILKKLRGDVGNSCNNGKRTVCC